MHTSGGESRTRCGDYLALPGQVQLVQRALGHCSPSRDGSARQRFARSSLSYGDCTRANGWSGVSARLRYCRFVAVGQEIVLRVEAG
jgi:hypothetical protein